MESITTTEQAGNLEEDLLTVADEYDPLKIVLQDEQKEILEKAIDALGYERWEKMLCLAYGLKGEKPHTYKEVAEIMECPKSRIDLRLRGIRVRLKNISFLRDYFAEGKGEIFSVYDEGLKKDIY